MIRLRKIKPYIICLPRNCIVAKQKPARVEVTRTSSVVLTAMISVLMKY